MDAEWKADSGEHGRHVVDMWGLSFKTIKMISIRHSAQLKLARLLGAKDMFQFS